ncbi:MAG: hypothetical protein Q4A61_00400 [Porphyromonadaceae bacterium]|nr:hypothetical protein [Porphyromonadaceae bacterium]
MAKDERTQANIDTIPHSANPRFWWDKYAKVEAIYRLNLLLLGVVDNLLILMRL